MTSEELRQRLKLAPFPVDVDFYEQQFMQLRAVYSETLKVAMQFARLVLPGVEITAEELTWAFSVTQSRANTRRGSAELIPLYDMFNHAPNPAVDFSAVTVKVCAAVCASMAMDADRTQLRVACRKGGSVPELLYRGEQLLGHLDDCVVLLAPSCGLREGDEAFTEYHDVSGHSQEQMISFIMAYGFVPADKKAS